MNDFIGNHIKFIVDWGQLIMSFIATASLILMYLLVRKNKYYLPRGILQSSGFVFLFILVLITSLVFARITQIKPGAQLIINQLDGLIGKEAPALAYNRISDDVSSSVGDHKSKIVLVNFWATWCQPCVKEIPHLQAIEDKYRTQGVKVLMISDEERNKLLKFTKKHGVAVEVGYTKAFDWVNLGNERPATFLIDRDGKIVEYITGGRDFQYFEEKIKPYL